jgi:hypothetical protein
MSGGFRRWSGLCAALVVAILAACSDDDGGSAEPSPDADTTDVGLDQIQVLAAHNAYHVEGEKALLEVITDNLPALTPTIEYTHPSLTNGLEIGVRSFELDLFEDPDGGRYGAPVAQPALGLEPIDPVMQEPGFKVFHIQEVDYRSQCLTFVLCLTELDAWSQDNPDHVPIVIHLEVKDGVIADPLNLGFVQPIPTTEGTFTAIEDEIHSVLEGEQIVTVGEVQGEADTLRAAIEADGWPDVDDLRGRFVFVLDDHDVKRDLYRGLYPDTRDRLIFVDAQPPEPDAAFTVLNDPVADGDRIRELVAMGYLVRTRTDADTAEARSGDTARREAAFESGAQLVSTDYEVEDARWPGYVTDLPGDGPARCNPVSAPDDCDDADLAGG